MNKYSNLIRYENKISNKYVHKIEVKEIENFKSKTYPITYKYKNEVVIKVQKMLDNKIIERCNTTVINPIVVVRKSNGELGLCLDARNINKYTVPQYETAMSTEAIFCRITGSNVISEVDLKHSFWLIPLHKSSRDFTAFTIDEVVYRFKVVPFGLQSSCSAFVKALHSILNKHEDFILHYIDEILIFSKDEASHLRHIDILLKEQIKTYLIK